MKKIKEKNSLPGICGRVCPQEEQCEAVCVLAKKGEPVAIGRLERFVADYELAQGEVRAPAMPGAHRARRSRWSAPARRASRSRASSRKMGHAVTVFEALHKPGGVLVYGIPEFRLPKAIVQHECDYVMKLGVEFRTSHVVGKLDTIDSLLANGFRRGLRRHGRGPPLLPGHPGREPERRLLGERVPHAHRTS